MSISASLLRTVYKLSGAKKRSLCRRMRCKRRNHER